MPKMSDDELIALVEKEESASLTHYSSVLSDQRRRAIDYYYSRPFGNETEGRSQVVTSEVKDAVEGILPRLMEIFMASDEIVRFDPQRPEDEDSAQQATDYVNYVFTRQNPGFLILYCLFKDALMVKNGYVKAYWEDYEDRGQETYQGLNDLDLQTLMNDPELELKDLNSYQDPNYQPPPLEMLPAGVPLPPAPQLHDAVFTRTKKHGKVCIDPCPAEEILISRECPNELTKARFVEHRQRKSISEIREMGFKIDEDIADYSPQADYNMERVARNSFDDALSYTSDDATADKTMRKVWLCEAYIKCDYDGDGIAELRKVTKVGTTLLGNEEFDGIPVIGGTAVMMPHKHYGLSVFDLIGDLQLLKSTVFRQLFDNAYIQNNGRMEVLDGMVNMSDLLTSRPNGVVRVKALGSVKRIDNPLLGAPFYNLLDYIDKVKVNRIGSRDFGDAVDPDALNAKAHTAELVNNAAQERINLMARILAEGPVKDIFWKILELTSKHQDKPQMVKLRGKWVQIDPREWRNKFDMTVTVGLGTGSQQATVNGMMQVMNVQAGVVKAGLMGTVLSPENVYNAARAHAKAIAPKLYDGFYSKPGTLQPPEPKPDPELLKIQLAAQKAQMGHEQKTAKLVSDRDIAYKQMGIEALGMAHEGAMQSRDQLHEHVQNTMDRGLDHAKHMDDKHEAARQEKGNGVDEDGVMSAVRTHVAAQSAKAKAEGAKEEAGKHSPNAALLNMAAHLKQAVELQRQDLANLASVVTASSNTQMKISEALDAIIKSQQETTQAIKSQKAPVVNVSPPEVNIEAPRVEQKPVKKKVKVIRDKEGNMTGAEVIEEPKGALS